VIKKYKKIKSVISEIVNEIDPENLMDIAPEDEYNDYVEKICSLIMNRKYNLSSLKIVFPQVSDSKILELHRKIEDFFKNK
jgi:6-pyruvoyl-tetrahydropterin synthase